MADVTIFALSIHADYKCLHSGVCCSSDWDVPVELAVYRTLGDAVARGALRPSTEAAALHPFIVEPDLPDDAAAMLERTHSGNCVFFDGGSHLCIVHRDLGEPALPATCRHFPRVAVRDARGTFITLSHYCPTAASMLFRDVPVAIVEGPAAFPEADYEGLVVTPEDLPPLLVPRMLMDHDGYSAWERHMVARCADLLRAPESIVATLTRDARALAAWKPGAVTLCDAVAQLPRGYVDAPAPASLAASHALRAAVVDAVPDDLKPDADEGWLEEAFATFVVPAWGDFYAPLNRYLAAKAFAAWTAYQGRGVASIVRGLESALALVRIEAARQCRNAGRRLDADLLKEAIRSSDFLLNHLAVGDELAERWSKAESPS